MKDRLLLTLMLPLCVFASVFALVRMLWSIAFSPARGWKLAVAHDQLGNTAANGHPDETISSRAGRAAERGETWGCVLCKVLDWFDPGHCLRFIESRFRDTSASR